MDNLYWISSALALDEQVQDIGVLQMALRAFVVYVFAFLAIKSAKRRFMGNNSAFDFVMVIILGSVISRGINGAAPMMASLAAGAVLVLVHRIVAWTTIHSPTLRTFVEGEAKLLVQNGTVNWEAMRKHDITEKDLHSALRQTMNTDDFSRVKHIYLEPNGKLSIVKK